MTGPFRVQPLMDPGHYKTYALRSPIETHTRIATCTEVDCPAHIQGWTTSVDEAWDLGQRQAYYIRNVAGRHYTETKNRAGLTVFTFPAGQKCFAEHRVTLDRPEHFYVRPGDWRYKPNRHEIYQHANAALWVEDFAEHQDKLATEHNKG